MVVAQVPSTERLQASTEALQHAIAELTDEEARKPSLLPGWTRGHVLTHLARNADALGNLITSAHTRTFLPMYPSRAERDAAIEAGSQRPAAELVSDVELSQLRLTAAMAQLSPDDWRSTIWYGADSREGVATVIPTLRRKVEVHHVDLDLGYPIFHWPPDFVDALLDQVTVDFAGRDSTPGVTLISHEDRRWTLAGGGQQVIGPAPALLGWLLGRTEGTGLTSEQPLPTLEAWR